MNSEIYEYFMTQYKDSKVKVVPGHWPDFKTKDEVDEWLTALNQLPDLIDYFKNTPIDDDDFENL